MTFLMSVRILLGLLATALADTAPAGILCSGFGGIHEKSGRLDTSRTFGEGIGGLTNRACSGSRSGVIAVDACAQAAVIALGATGNAISSAIVWCRKTHYLPEVGCIAHPTEPSKVAGPVHRMNVVTTNSCCGPLRIPFLLPADHVQDVMGAERPAATGIALGSPIGLNAQR